MALMLGGPLSGFLLELDGKVGLHGWQWMFLVEGFLASVVGVCAYFYLTDGPNQASWMPLAEQTTLAEAIAEEEERKRQHGVATLRDVFRNRRMLQFVAIYFLIQVTGYGVAFYLPTQVSKLLGAKIGIRVGVVSAIPWACAIVSTCFWPSLAARTGRRRTFACLSLLMAVAGLCVSANVPPGPAIAALCAVTVGIITVQPIFWTFPTAYLGGVGAAGGLAAINALGNVGGLVAPTLKTFFEQTFHSDAAGLYFLAAAGVCATGLVLTLPASWPTDPAP
jgi:sugar phosphate permease